MSTPLCPKLPPSPGGSGAQQGAPALSKNTSGFLPSLQRSLAAAGQQQQQQSPADIPLPPLPALPPSVSPGVANIPPPPGPPPPAAADELSKQLSELKNLFSDLKLDLNEFDVEAAAAAAASLQGTAASRALRRSQEEPELPPIPCDADDIPPPPPVDDDDIPPPPLPPPPADT
eukprot:m51a1_g13684 hypothetical protein (174) ;mRNA; f:348-869